MNMDVLETVNLDVRFMQRAEMPQVFAIEENSFEFPWTESEFLKTLCQIPVVGCVAAYGDKVLGYMVYMQQRNKMLLLNLAVAPPFRRRGIGSVMIKQLSHRCSVQRKPWVEVEIRDTNLYAQLFFRSQGFLAVGVMKEFYDETREDAYLFEYRVPKCEGKK